MVISVLVIAELVELLAIFWGAKLLKQELKRHSKEVDTFYGSLFGALINVPSWNDLRKEWDKKAAAQASILNELQRDLEGMQAQRKKDIETLLAEQGTTAGAFRMVFEKMNEMPSRQDLAKSFKQSEEPTAGLSQEQETAMSKAMEEGISSILGYTAGKVPGVELRL